MGFVTHCEIPITSYQQLARGNGVDRTRRRRQGHCLENLRAVAHHRDAGDLQPKAATFLRGAKKARILASIALGVLLHGALGAAKYTDLESLLVGNEAAIVAPSSHDCRCGRRGHGRGKRRGPSTVVVGGVVRAGVIAIDGRVGIARVGIQVARDLRAGRRRQ